MTDGEIIKHLAWLQARGEPGAAQARAFVVGDWLPRWEWDLIYVALLKLAGTPCTGRLPAIQGEQDCQLLLEALRGLL